MALMGWTRNLVLAASAAVIGSSFQFGYNTGVINAPGAIIQEFMNDTHFERYGTPLDHLQLSVLWGLAVSIFAIGGMIGSLAAGYTVSKVGRKKTMLGNNVLAMLSFALMGCSKVAQSYEMLIIGRLLIGVNCGINMTVAPLYLTEIAPVRLRGVLGSSNQLGVVTALLISQLLGLHEALGKGFDDDAKYSLQFLRGRHHDVDYELENMRSEASRSVHQRKVSISEIFAMRNFRKPMIVAIVMQLAQQLSGITAVLYYSTKIFVSAGVPEEDSDLVTVAGVGTHWGSVVAVTVVMLCVMFFQTGPGSIPWFITAELFPESARASAMSIAGVVNWGANFIVGIAYLPLQSVIDGSRDERKKDRRNFSDFRMRLCLGFVAVCLHYFSKI